MSDVWKHLYQRAGAHHGLVTATLLDELEIPRSTFSDHARDVGCKQRHRTVWTLPGTEWTFVVQCAAGQAAVGLPALLTGDAGLHILGATTPRPRAATFLISSERSGRGHRRVVVRRSTRFADLSSTTVDGLRIALVEQCCIDGARELGVDALIRRMATACRLRLTDLDLLEAYGDAAGAFRGLRGWRLAVQALRGELVHSNPEQVARDALRPLGLGFTSAPFLVVDGAGRRVGEVDLAIPEIRYGAEIDGPHHELEEQQRKDEHRDQQLRDLEWRIDRHRWDDVTNNPARFARKVAAAVASRRRELGLTAPTATF
jgi:hypothetical protein